MFLDPETTNPEWLAVFGDRVEIEGECVLWTGSKNLGGYGQFTIRKRQIGAHRASYALASGIDFDDLPEVVMHRCDTPACVRPAHLQGGTHRENVADKVAKGRQHRAVSEGRIREALAWIQANPGWGAQRAAARRFGLRESYLSGLVAGRYRGDGIGRYADRGRDPWAPSWAPEDLAEFRGMLGGRGRVPYGRSAELCERFSTSPEDLRRTAKWLIENA